MVIDDRVAIDAGSLALSCSDLQREQIRDIILTHTHLDHIAGLPLFIDDLFATLTEPVRVHGTRQVIEALERDVFNWSIYPRFSELANSHGPVISYHEFEPGAVIEVGHLTVRSVPVNHKVASSGYIVSDGTGTIAITGDTAETDEIWQVCGRTPDLRAIFVECAFPNELAELALVSGHLTPAQLAGELRKVPNRTAPAYVINIKPMYRSRVIEQLGAAGLDGVEPLEVGRVYEF
jgi:cAMP phosphodiesterase